MSISITKQCVKCQLPSVLI